MSEGLSEDEWASLLYGDDAEAEDMAEVDAAIAAGEAPTAAQGYPEASWQWRHANRDDAKADMYEEVIRAEITRLEGRLDEMAGPHRRRAEWRRRSVSMWHRAAYAKDPGSIGKTVKFPSGGNSELRAERPVIAGEPDHDRLRDYLDTVADSDGVKLSESVYRVKEPDFLVSALNSAITVPKGAEPGTVVEAVGPDGKKVPGIKFIVREDRWQHGGKSKKSKK